MWKIKEDIIMAWIGGDLYHSDLDLKNPEKSKLEKDLGINKKTN